MCGICGVVYSETSGRSVDPDRLARMRDTLTHRGPDEAGLWVDGRVGLGHRRLSIVDLASGQQPMRTDDGALHIVYNGEVYNHLEVRADLETRGHRYRTRCDTETVMRAYAEDGERGVERLRGMFAFAIWDARRNELVLGRDRLGVKPLYYVHTSDGSLYFASEIKALVEAGAVRARLNAGVFADYLANHAPSGDETMFEGVRRLPPGHTLRWSGGRVDVRRYWDVSFAGQGADGRGDDEMVEQFSELFDAAVRIRLMADVPLGVFLSGGIDSAAITATMAKFVDEPIRTFSVAFAERDANELEYARIVARAYGTDHHEVVVSPEDFFGALPRLVWHEDEPIAHPSSVPLHFVSELASRHVKVVLTGEGSDELLAGYARYWKTLQNLRFAQSYHGATTSGIRALVRRAISALPRASKARQKLQRTFLFLEPQLESIYFDNFAVFGRQHLGGMLAPAMRENVGASDPYWVFHEHMAATDAPTMLDRLLYTDIKTYLHELLMKQDQMSMSASIESRVPFLDHKLVEFVAGLPDEMKLRGRTTKYVLRRAMRNVLPAEILERPKMGFPVPFGSWVRGPFRHVVDDLVLGPRALERGLLEPAAVRRLVAEHQAGVDHSERLWSLVNLELWQRRFIDGETPVSEAVPAAGTAFV